LREKTSQTNIIDIFLNLIMFKNFYDFNGKLKKIFNLKEISRVRVNLFQLGSKEGICLPEPVGPPMQLTEKLYVPVKDHPEVSFFKCIFFFK
jgi:hypothetical protein